MMEAAKLFQQQERSKALIRTFEKKIPVGNTRPGEFFTVFTGIILTAETERVHKGTSFTANIKVQKTVRPDGKNISVCGGTLYKVF